MTTAALRATPQELEPRIQAIGRHLLTGAREGRHWWTRFTQEDALLERLMASEALRTTALRFVDVLPALADDRELTRHLEEYFGDDQDLRLPFPAVAHWTLKQARGEFAAHLLAPLVRAMANRMARRFIAGHSPDSARPALHRLHKRGMGFTLDVLGEAVLSETESQQYQQTYLNLLRELDPIVRGWEASPRMDQLSGRRSPRLNLSIKLSALYSQIEPIDPDTASAAIKEKLRPILREARRVGAFITVDMEQYDTKEITLRVFEEVLTEAEFADWPDAGLAMQAYLRDTPDDVSRIIAWAQQRGTPVTIRLVRGAYWDYETVIAQQHHWPAPVWTNKADTDRCYEHCLRLLLEAYPAIETAAGTHNVRSIAVTMATAEQLGLTPMQYELQMLYGMADEVKQQLVEAGQRLRVYVPFGELLPGMAYLVRRLLENTGSQSFLRMGFSDNVDIDEVLAPPRAPGQHPPLPPVTAVKAPAFVNVSERRFTAAAERERFSAAVSKVRGQLGGYYPLIIGGEAVKTAAELRSLNPAVPAEVVGVAASAGASEAERAIKAAQRAFVGWRGTTAAQRAAILRKAADTLEQHRDGFAAWEVFEAGKPWREADADVCEAIDYLRYYAQQAVDLERGHKLDVPGETNRYFYEPRGVGAVIAPWNFPLAIPLGMTVAAIATGNCVILKPAPQTPVIAALFTRLLHDAGLPPGVLNYLPGGDEAGKALVAHPAVHFIAFTGSLAAGSAISRTAAEIHPTQHHLKFVMAELGGKNAIIVDSDADIDDAVAGTMRSAFGYAGQKCSACSRVIVVGDIYEAFLRRLVEASSSLRVGPPTSPGSYVPPVIDGEAHDRILKTIEAAKQTTKLALEVDVSHVASSGGYYIGPTIFADVDPASSLAQDEIFGPVLSVIRARSFDEAMIIANSTRYALTGGLYSRSPAHLERARREFRVGNLYLNRRITGAIVGRQPFGGFKLSGTDAKAGGPDYVKHFVLGRVVTENTIRRGFAPSENAEPSH